MADLNNVQGDILVSLPKNNESFIFFNINGDQVPKFREQLYNLVPLVTTARQGQENVQKCNEHQKWKHGGAQKPIGKDFLTITGINIAFSYKGLEKLQGAGARLDGDINDVPFKEGMAEGAADLGDPVDENKTPIGWVDAFKNGVDGVVLVTGDCEDTVEASIAKVHKVFSIDTLEEVFRKDGKVRPGNERGHEHFGFLDGVSQPAIEKVDTIYLPGQDVVPQGIILLGRDGDSGPLPPGGALSPTPFPRPNWAKDGSFLAYRQLKQLVPQFHAFMERYALPPPTPPPNAEDPNHPTGAQWLAARIIGRWPSGAPIDITPFKDNTELGGNKLENNVFRYDFKNPDDQSTQLRCPFAAHTRKTNPRADLDAHNGTVARRILRRGIQFGPEVQEDPDADRGLLFACYQSVIANGFQFVQQSWANEPRFPPDKPADQKPGLDAVIGAPTPLNGHATRELSGADGRDPDRPLFFNQWVISQGGEYFFSPSISTLRDILALRF